MSEPIHIVGVGVGEVLPLLIPVSEPIRMVVGRGVGR